MIKMFGLHVPRGRVDSDAMGQQRAPRARGDEGAVLVEFALTLPLLVMLLLGMFSGGLAYNQKMDMTHATREGARYAATVAPTQTMSCGTGCWATSVRDLVVERSFGDLTTAQVCVSLVFGTGGGTTVYPGSGYSTSGSPCIPNQTYPTTSSDTGVRVQVVASRPASIELGLFGRLDITLRSEATAKSESAT